MKRIIILFLLLASVGVFASNEQLRTFVLSQFRSIVEPLLDRGESTQPQFDSFYSEMVDDLAIQQRAEKALELSINRFKGASDYVLHNAQDWRGEIKTNSRLSTLIDVAMNAPMIETRMAGFELYLAQHNIEKSAQQVDKLLTKFEKDPQGAGPWVLWNMALIGARGVDRIRVFDELLIATENPDKKIRRWAVDSLAKFGGEEVVLPLLQIAYSDSSSLIKERAFCGLAQSATLQIIERYGALPGLLVMARDSQSSKQTLEWVYQALKEISNFYDIPNDPNVWEGRLLEVDMIQL